MFLGKMVIVDIFLLLVGFLVIYFSVDYLLDELEEYLETYNISPTIFGVLILGMDIEESIASIFGAIEGLPLLAIGNLVGNSIIAISIAFAIPILLIPFLPEPIPKTYYLILLLSAINLFISLIFPQITWIFGILAIGLFVYMFVFSIRYQLDYDPPSVIEPEADDENDAEGSSSWMRHSVVILIALALVIAGGELLVISAENIIEDTELSESFFGLVIMAFLTNVEEFWLMLQAIRKNQVELGISAQVGKIIWNITLIYGLSALIIQSYASEAIMLWSGVLFLVIIILLIWSLVKSKLNKATAFSFLSILLVFFVINIIAIL
jgi:cation:H+ antiporter